MFIFVVICVNLPLKKPKFINYDSKHNFVNLPLGVDGDDEEEAEKRENRIAKNKPKSIAKKARQCHTFDLNADKFLFVMVIKIVQQLLLRFTIII